MQDPEPLLHERYTPKAIEFMQYWFLPETQLQLLALVQALECLPDGPIRNFMEVAFSSIIVTKSGGVSLARDLAHSRPHKDESKKIKDAVTFFTEKAEKALVAMEEFSKAPGKAYVVR